MNNMFYIHQLDVNVKLISSLRCFQPYIFSDSHHPNPTNLERIYRAFFLPVSTFSLIRQEALELVTAFRRQMSLVWMWSFFQS